MVSVEERMRVLNLLKEGSISPEQAAQLLQAMDADTRGDADEGIPPAATPAEPAQPARAIATPDLPPAPPAGSGATARWLRVRVSDMNSGRPRVNIRLPLSLVNFGLKMGRNFAPEMEHIDVNELAEVLQSGEPGPFVDVYDEEDGEHVEVFLE